MTKINSEDFDIKMSEAVVKLTTQLENVTTTQDRSSKQIDDLVKIVRENAVATAANTKSIKYLNYFVISILAVSVLAVLKELLAKTIGL